MSKPVQLQGWGEGSTTINALKQPVDKLEDWRLRVQGLIESGAVDLLPGQEAAFGGIEQVALMTEEGAGVLVLAPSGGRTASLSAATRAPASTASPSPVPTPAAASSSTATATTWRSPTTASPTTRVSTAAASASATR